MVSAQAEAALGQRRAVVHRDGTTVARGEHARSLVLGALVVLGAVLAGYLLWVALRPEFTYTSWLNGWSVAGFEIVVSLLCASRALLPQPGRIVALALGVGFLSWSLGDAVAAAYTANDSWPAGPSWADLLWLGFYPFAYIGVVLFVRQEIRRIADPSWLDGAIAALGAAAVCAAFAFQSVLQSAGRTPLAVAVNVAYPVGDLVLLGLVVGGATLLSGHRSAPWALLASAMALNTVGDTFNLFKSSLATPRTTAVLFVLAWPTSALLTAVAMWLRPRRPDPLAPEEPASFVLPGLAAMAALGVLVAGSLHQVSAVAAVLAATTLAVVGVRLARSVRGLRSATRDRLRESITDDLTGLKNRRYLVEVLDDVFRDQAADPMPRRLTLLYLDLDHFKQVNDSFGHAAGDELLQQLGPRLTGVLGDAGAIVRVGGDELAALLMDTDADDALVVARRLVDSIEQPFLLNGLRATVSVSIGIASAPADATESVGLLRAADIAMYRAKLGGTSIAVFDPVLDGDGNQWSLGEELAVAIERGQLELHYQPQLDVSRGVVTAVEALLRWSHPRLGAIPPQRFLPLAEQAGLMPAVTSWVMDQALARCATWRATGQMVSVSVNASPTNLDDPAFPALVEQLLQRHALPADALVVEITETSVMANFEVAKRAIAELGELGVTVSIDDFGAGFTSLAYLSDLAVGELKLDGSFITNLADADRARDVRLVRATIELGHAIGLRVVAECIEDRATLDLLTAFGCDVGQGYLIGRPVPADDLSFDWVRSDAPAPALSS